MAEEVNGKKKNRLWTVLMWLAICVFVGAVGYLGAVVYSYWSDNARYEEIADKVFDPKIRDKAAADASLDPAVGLAAMTVDWDALREINSDIVAWIYIPDTRVSYPVCWSGDNDTYLFKDFDGNQGVFTGCGTIFLDGENEPDFSDQLLAMYGHHMIDGSMFACLSDFADEEVFEDHREVYVLTPTRNSLFRSFSLVRTDGSDTIVQTNFPTKADMNKYIVDKQERSMVEPKEGFIAPDPINQLLMLSTCDYNQDNGRAVLFCYLEEVATPANSEDPDDLIGSPDGFVGA